MSDGAELRAIAHELCFRPRFARQPGLDRMRRLLSADGAWTQLPVIKVVGSNGKGSVATLVASILQELGLKVGLYTSPHLRFFNERIRLSGRPAPVSMLQSALTWLRPRLKSPVSLDQDPPLAFEAMTALALRVFETAGVEVVVAEAGIGGRFDATRVTSGAVSALVSVDLEHTALLGGTLEAIALDKAEIADPGSVLMIGDLPATIRTVVAKACRRRGVEPRSPTLDDPRVASLSVAYQRRNAALAAAVVECWLVQRHMVYAPSRVDLAISRACRSFQLPGRMERVQAQPEAWIDVAHTPAALAAVAEAVRGMGPGHPWLVVFGVSADKEQKVRSMVQPLQEIADRFVCTRAEHRAGSVDLVTQAVQDLGRPYERYDDLRQALESALRTAETEGCRILVTGGLFLAVEAGEILAGRDPKDLSFF